MKKLLFLIFIASVCFGTTRHVVASGGVTSGSAADSAHGWTLAYALSTGPSAGDTVYTIVRSVSASGMSRTLSLYIVKDNRLVNITYYAAHALEWRLVDVNGSRVMRVGGCGMDM